MQGWGTVLPLSQPGQSTGRLQRTGDGPLPELEREPRPDAVPHAQRLQAGAFGSRRRLAAWR